MPQEDDRIRTIAGCLLKNNARLVLRAAPDVTVFVKSAVLTAFNDPSIMIRGARSAASVAPREDHARDEQRRHVALEACEFWLTFAEDPDLAPYLHPLLAKVAPTVPQRQELITRYGPTPAQVVMSVALLFASVLPSLT